MATAYLDGKMVFMVQFLLPIRDRWDEIGVEGQRDLLNETGSQSKLRTKLNKPLLRSIVYG
jgi:hypothetical protein